MAIGSSIVMSIVVAVAVALTSGIVSAQGEMQLAPVLHVYGASTVDSGNNKILRNDEKTSSLLYGVDLKYPSLLARATNGLTYADVMAEHLRLPSSPPVLSFKDVESRPKILTGMNYASSSSVILNHTELLTRECLPLSKQIDLFERTLKHDLPWKISLENKLTLHLEKSIILISISGNDYILRYFIDKTMSAELDLNSCATLLVQSFSASIEVDLGAKKFVVLGMLPIGCSNFSLDQNQGKCIETVTKIIESYKSQLTAALDHLQNNRAILYILINPAKLDVRKAKTEIGSKFMFKQCCEVDKFGGRIKGSKACENRVEHLLFDKNHMSQIYQKYIADGCFKGTGMCLPCDVVELCRK